MNALMLVLALVGSAPSIEPSPLEIAWGRVQGDLAALSDAQAAVAALELAKVKLAAVQEALAADRKALEALIDANVNPKPVPVPVPVVVHRVEIIEVASSSCGPCNLMKPVLDSLVKDGVAIKRVNVDQDDAVPAEWKTLSTPTFIMQVDGKEVSRGPIVGGKVTPGRMDHDQLKTWYDATVEWSHKLKAEK